MKLYIKNMVCDRCRLVIENQLVEMKLTPVSVELGEVDFGEQTLDKVTVDTIRKVIEPLGFELIDDKKSRLIEKMKKAIIKLAQQQDGAEKIKLSDYLADILCYDYGHLSNLFSSIEGVTIEQYYLRHRIEKVKELLIYDELSLTEIADHLGYSSVAHLSSQFKKMIGMPPSQFKKMRDNSLRQSLDKV